MIEPGQEIGHYRIIRRLGSGGMADVYEALDLRLERSVALKYLSDRAVSEDSDMAVRFETEAKAVAGLDHPGIVPLYDFGEVEDHCFFTMPMLPGGDLEQRIRERSIDAQQALVVTAAIADALDYAHRRGVIHRDIKPANVLFDRGEHPVIADFGIAKVQDVSNVTRAGTTVGTVSYMSPEQAVGRDLDGRSDVYSLGVMLYEVLTGQRPFRGESMAILFQHLNEPPPPLPDELSQLQPLIKRVLSKNPDKRPSAAEFAALCRQLHETWSDSPIFDPARVDDGPAEDTFSTLSPLDSGERELVGQIAAKHDRQAESKAGADEEAAHQVAAAPPPSQGAVGEAAEKRRSRAALLSPVASFVAALAVGAILVMAWNRFGLQDPPVAQAAKPTPVIRADATEATATPQPVAIENTAAAADVEPELAPIEPVSGRLRPDDVARLAELAERFSQQLAVNKLSRPAGDNATETLQAIRALDPEHPTAVTGNAQLSAAYLKLFDRDIVQGKLRKAGRYLAKAKAFDADSSGVTAAEQELADALDAARRGSSEGAFGMVADRKVGEIFRDCAACPEMVRLPTGRFTMGSNEGEADERPRHAVTISYPLAVGRFEVTFAQWDACVQQGGCGGYRPDDETWGRGKHPVVNVSWQDAQNYVSWLSRATGREYRLLSEAEWEFAARAGTTTDFHTGRCIRTDQANFRGEGGFRDCRDETSEFRSETTPVGSFAPNPYGLYDVHGNVWEWTQDCWQRDYGGAPRDGQAVESANCDQRIVRGGSWSDKAYFLRSSDRERFTWQGRGDYYGFRVASSD